MAALSDEELDRIAEMVEKARRRRPMILFADIVVKVSLLLAGALA